MLFYNVVLAYCSALCFFFSVFLDKLATRNKKTCSHLLHVLLSNADFAKLDPIAVISYLDVFMSARTSSPCVDNYPRHSEGSYNSLLEYE